MSVRQKLKCVLRILRGKPTIYGVLFYSENPTFGEPVLLAKQGAYVAHCTLRKTDAGKETA